MKKGFTLVEILGVVIILAVLATLILQPILRMTRKTQSTIDDATKSLILTAANQYTSKYENNFQKYDGSTYCLTVKDLVGEKFLADSILEDLNTTIQVDVVNEKYQYTILDSSQTCTTKIEIVTPKVKYKDDSLANEPILLNGMVPIVYDETDKVWKVADKYEKWYDYNSKEWANAAVLNNGVSKAVGDSLNISSDVALMFVWIPRYEYKLPADSLGTTGTPKAIDIKFIKSSQTTADSGYSLHPGFTFGGVNKSGIWFGKFEPSTSAPITDFDLSSSNKVQVIKIVPNVASWSSVQPANMFTSSRNLETDYSLTGYDSHMARYLEWTTVSYLTNSIYGRCSDANTCTEVTINNSGNNITGNAGNEIADSEAFGTTNAYDTTGGVLASTTGNIYGIYDMSGGADEYVMGLLERESGIPYVEYASDSIWKSGFKGINGYDNSEVTDGIDLPDSKYYDLFTSSDKSVTNYSVITAVNGSSSMNGVFKELLGTNTTQTTSWYGDSVVSVHYNRPWFTLGYIDFGTAHAGVFASSCNEGGAGIAVSFRVVMVTK